MFRDPREVVISEHRMRIEVYHLGGKTAELDPFIYGRFEVHPRGKMGANCFVLSDLACLSTQ